MAPKPASSSANSGGRNLLQNILFGGVAGVVGQSCVFPMYTIKTNLHLYPGRYNNVFDCARTILQREGLRGLYRGLPPALTGVFPEKAIKLSMNDYLTALLSRPDGSISLPMAMLAGGGAGFSQVIATNPMELVMINMQNAAAQGHASRNMFQMASQLGLSGLYKGTQATLLRDVPFSMVFFSMNTFIRRSLTDERGHLPMSKVFFAGMFSASTAAAMSTPCDVIKTRLQAVSSSVPEAAKPSVSTPPVSSAMPSTSSSATQSRPFSSSAAIAAERPPPVRYEGIAHCAKHIYATEGLRGFFAGVVPRILIISPLFGITLFFYDMQRRFQQSKKTTKSQ